jgi:hypothetical protein
MLSRKDVLCTHWRKHSQNLPNIGDLHVPKTFLLPEEFSQFKSEFEGHANTTWILKPIDMTRGIGIQIIKSLEQIPSGCKTARYQYIQI